MRVFDPLLDTMAGNYRLVERLGAGGMGEVYKGVHETIGSRVAIKVLHATAARDQHAQQRFLREAQAVNRIAHEGVVKIIDAGRLENGRPFLVMELLDGQSLQQLKRERRLAIREACLVMIDVLDALAAAHDAGVIHRDLKPANIFRTRGGRTIILDFGVAKLMAADAPVRLTITGAAVGTPDYMAPEQLRGEQISPAADLYAVGVVLFELVCGRRPFDGDEESAIVGHLQRRPPPPRALEPAVPIAVQDVILTALAKDPARRFASAVAMRDALRAALPDEEPRSPWARPASVETEPDTARESPIARTPETERDHIPSAVVAHRTRRRAIAFGVIAVIIAAATVVIASRTPAREAVVVAPRDAAAVAIVVDAHPVVAQEIDAAPPPTCSSLVQAHEPRAVVRALLYRSCEETAWSASAIECYLGAPEVDPMVTCIESLSLEQRHKLLSAAAPAKPVKPAAKPIDKPRSRPPVEHPTTSDLDVLDPFSRPRADQGWLEIRCKPDRASVWIDGEPAGPLPVKKRVSVGRHSVQFHASGYAPMTSVVHVSATNLAFLDVELTLIDKDAPE